MFNGSDPVIHSIKQSTPFEVTASGALGVGVFRKTKGVGQIVVEVLRFADDKPMGSSRSTDDGVVFGEYLIDRYDSFSRTFTWPGR